MHPPNRAATATAAGIAAVVVVTSISAPAVSTASPRTTALVRTAVAVQSAHVQAGMIRLTTARTTTVSARSLRGSSRATLVRFSVPAGPSGYTLAGARLAFVVTNTTRAALVASGSSDRWGVRAVRYPPSSAGTALDRASVSAGQHRLGFDVRKAVRPGNVSFAVSASRGTTTVATIASGRRTAPRLVLSYEPMASVAATPSTAPTAASPSPSSGGAAAPAPSTATRVRIGMSAPAGEWSSRLAETGGVDSRRLFGTLSSPNGVVDTATTEVAAGRYPVLSFKVPNDDWAGAAAGKYDSQLKATATRLGAINGRVFVTLHHEPQNDGTPANYAAMLTHALPILGVPANVDVGPIVHGFWWSAKPRQAKTDAEIAQWLPPRVLEVSDIVAADCYQGGTVAAPGEGAGPKIQGMSRWAARVGVTQLAVGEYNGLSAASITAAGKAVLADPRFRFADVFNSNENNRPDVDWQLSGARLTAFKATVAQARASR